MLNEYRAEFNAMGTEVKIIAVAEKGDELAAHLLKQAETLFHREEARFSRFLPDSELNCLNRQRRLVDPSPEFWDVLCRAEGWYRATGGYFDPAILSALEAAGYDRSFATLALEGATVLNLEPPQDLSANFSRVNILEVGGRRVVRLTGGTRLDLGGLVKGWTVDRARELLTPLGNYLIDAGGDIFAAGNSTNGAGWWIGVEDPQFPETDLGYLQVSDEAVATSAVYRRRWCKANGSEHCHLIDPKTTSSTASDIISVTVLGPNVEACEVYAKVVLLLGSLEGFDLLQRIGGIKGQIVTQSGFSAATDGWQQTFVPADKLEESV